VITRRHAIGSGVAASALGSFCPAASAAGSPARIAPPVALVVVDERFEAASALARTVVAPGARHVAMTRDVLELWHRQLAPACQHGALCIAGVTTERGFFLLHTLAADQRLRVLSRTNHGALVSWLIGPK
jgi:hypothetical protein